MAPQVPPPAKPLTDPLVKQPLTKAQLEQWRGDIKSARDVRRKVEPWWDANLRRYAPSQTDSPETYAESINTNRDFTLVERKKADLFYQRPDLMGSPSPLMEGHEVDLATHITILNEKLGLDGVNAKAMVHRTLFDSLCTSGMGWTVMGYESVTVPVPTTDAMGQPTTADVPIFEDCFWKWISPKCGLIPANARTTDTDSWPWIGYDFELPTRMAVRKGWVPEDFKGSPPSQEMYFDHGLSPSQPDDVVRGSVVVYKSALYRDDRIHPLHQTLLILIDGVDEPAEHKDSPYQTIDAMGHLTPDSLIGFPVHPLAIRVLTDSAYIPSDCTISSPLVRELNKFREQMVEQRENTLLKYAYNVDTLPKDALEKIVRSPVGGFIGLPSDAFVGEGAIKEIPHGTYPRENFSMNDYLDNDLARTHAIDAEQSGAGQGGTQSATESQIKQNNVNARLGLERGVVLDWYVAGATKYSQILQRLLPVEDAAQIVGQQAAAQWDTWRKTIPASLAFTALPNSALRTDGAVEQKQTLDTYSFWANDPFINRPELIKWATRRTGIPPTVLNPNGPPPKSPEPPTISLALKSEDLNPVSPAYANVYQILTQQGVKNLQPPVPVDPMTLQQFSEIGADTQTAHGGKTAPAENLSKHHAALTGGVQGMQQPGALGGAVQ